MSDEPVRKLTWKNGQFVEVPAGTPEPPHACTKVFKKSEWSKAYYYPQMELFKKSGNAFGGIVAILRQLNFKANGDSVGKPFTFGNEVLKGWGISRDSKYRVLAELEEDGWIKVERKGKAAPVITLLKQF